MSAPRDTRAQARRRNARAPRAGQPALTSLPAAGHRERIAVLGAGGFIGSHLVPALLARRDCVVDAVDLRLDKLAEFPGDRVRRWRTSIDHPGLIDEITARCDVVVSLTALCNPALYNTRPLEVIDASYTDLVPLAKACAARGKWLVHLSTCEVYGRVALSGAGRRTARMDEDQTGLFLGPVHRERWSYAAAKALLERVIWALGLHHGLKFTLVRPFNVIGPRMDFVPGVDGEGIPRVLASFMSALMAGQDLMLVDGGRQRRSFLAVGELVGGLLRILERPQHSQGQILNLGNPRNDVTVRQLARAITAAYRAQRPEAPRPRLRHVSAEAYYGPGYDDSAVRVPSIRKAERLLDWRPRVRLDQMLPPIVADYLDRYEALVQAAPATRGRARSRRAGAR